MRPLPFGGFTPRGGPGGGLRRGRAGEELGADGIKEDKDKVGEVERHHHAHGLAVFIEAVEHDFEVFGVGVAQSLWQYALLGREGLGKHLVEDGQVSQLFSDKFMFHRIFGFVVVFARYSSAKLKTNSANGLRVRRFSGSNVMRN